MEIKKIDSTEGLLFRIIEESGDEFYVGVDEVNLTEDEQQKIAIEKFNVARERETNPPPPSYQELRIKEYPSANELIVALWEFVVESRPEAKNVLQAKRMAIKNKYPKK